MELLLQCEPNSQVYNHLKRTLDLVGEMSRVALENAHATASEASTQATGCGGGRRGFRGVDAVEVVHTVEVVEVVTRMTMSWVTSNSNTFNSY